MKKKVLFVLMSLVLLAGMAHAQTWHTANQSTVAWDPVTTLEDGATLPSGDEVRYDVYLANAATDPEKTNPALIAEDLTTLEHTATLNVEGRFFVGVKAKRYVDGELVGESPTAWSDSAEHVADGDTFGLRYFMPPAAPKLKKP